MNEMNVSITDNLAGYLKRQVQSGRYLSASEVVREALRRMEEAERAELRLAEARGANILADLDGSRTPRYS